MDLEYSQGQAQRVLRQRNMLALTCAGLSVLTVASLIAASVKDREIVLQPIAGRSVTISSRAMDRDYLELVTRDTAVLMFNRTPQSADYWMNQVLKIAHPSAYGKLKGELIKIVDDQRGSSVAQFFTMEKLTVDPKGLSSTVTGVLHTMVGREEVSAIQRTFQFKWTYTGLELRLIGFRAVEPATAGPASQSNASGEATP
ncbi:MULTISPECIES: type IV conjugative transfer system protein TraE [unclassified Sphingobium]|uniref:type IV conjugative transfer system protein TraE n=1 Tax=unclassified Sphingobium TaxID=2611147 RepID=UPI002225527C|nr:MULTISPECIES: type IV conjugative transfer system protein TraE [unclassified Sphingobium]